MAGLERGGQRGLTGENVQVPREKGNFFHPDITRLRAGGEVSRNEWEKWFESANPYYMGVAMTILGRDADAHEVVATTWEKLIKAVKDPKREIHHIETYARVALHNHCFTALKRGQQEVDIEPEIAAGNVKESSSAEKKTHVTMDDFEELFPFIQELSPSFQEQLFLLAEGLSVPEVARRLTIPPGTAKSRRSRALDALKEHMSPPREVVSLPEKKIEEDSPQKQEWIEGESSEVVLVGGIEYRYDPATGTYVKDIRI